MKKSKKEYTKYLHRYTINKGSRQLPNSKRNKGEANDVCYRTACGNEPATYYNLSTHKYYCTSCAHLLNTYSPGLCILDRSLFNNNEDPS
jgi:hypothetical protein